MPLVHFICRLLCEEGMDEMWRWGVRGWMICGGHIHPSWHARQLGSHLERERGRETRLRRSSPKNKQPNKQQRDRPPEQREIGRRREGDGDVPHGNGCSMACPSVASPNSRLRQTTQLLKGRDEGREKGSEPLRRARR